MIYEKGIALKEYGIICEFTGECKPFDLCYDECIEEFNDEYWSILIPTWWMVRDMLLEMRGRKAKRLISVIQKAISTHCDITTAHTLIVEGIKLLKNSK